MGIQRVYGKGAHPLLWTGSPAARGKIIVAGVSEEEILVAFKETSNKQAIWNKE
jgi:hypothetical protein